ncbi:MAG: glycosyltransferase 87 family protein [Solirubrobacteraceae bacterium]
MPTSQALRLASSKTLARAPGRLATGARSRRVASWLLFTLSVGIYFWIWLVVRHQPFHVGPRRLRFFDLRIYLGAAWRVLRGRALYRKPIIYHLGFTYPPFAALLFTALTRLPLQTDEVLVTTGGILLLLFTARRALAIRRPSAPDSRPVGASPADAWALAALAAAVALWLEPVTVALGYGQIDLAVVALVVFDISLPDDSRWKGVATGLAAAIKLTPLMFLAYLLFSARVRAAARGTFTFAATIAVSFLVLPADASRYWGALVFRSSRVGPAADVGNQSMRGALARLLGETHPGLGVMALVGLVALAGLLLAVRASRRGDEAAGFALCAVTTLLASPVSWTHHWTLVMPALLLLAVSAPERQTPWLAAAALGGLALFGSYLPESLMPALHHGLGQIGAHAARSAAQPRGFASLAEDPYVGPGLLALLTNAVLVANAHYRTRRGARWWLHPRRHRAAAGGG